MKNIWVGIIDDHELFSNGLEKALDLAKGISVVLRANDGEELLKKLETIDKLPDVLLMDIEMEGMDGLEATKKVKKEYPDIKIIILTMHYEESYIIYLLKLGVDGYIFKNARQYELEKAILAVNEGENYFNNTVQKVTVEALQRKRISKPIIAADGNPLTDREKEVLIQICRGKTNVEIAKDLFLSKRTIDSHRLKLLKKTKSKNTAELIAYAVNNNIFSFSTDNI